MRVALTGFFHETNWFGNLLVTPQVLGRGTVDGKKPIEQYAPGSYLVGIAEEAKARSVDLVTVTRYAVTPSGRITREALEAARDTMVKELCEAHAEKPLDGIALALHGAAAAEGYPDVEGEILRAVREKLGREIPIGVCLDLHANVTEEMVALSDVLIGVRCYPHVDEPETGREMMKLLCDAAQSGKRPCMRLIKLPWLLVPAYGLTTSGAGSDVRERCLAAEARDPRVLRTTFFHGFPYADIAAAGVSVVAVADTEEAADAAARNIARYAWDKRHAFTIPTHSAKEAVDLALSQEDGPVVINESSDNPGGGTPADGTHLLRELIERNVPSAFGYIRDPEVAQQAAKAGVGAHISCRLGGKTDHYHGEPIEIEDAYVRSVCDGTFVMHSPMGKGSRGCYGTTVCLVVGNVSIVVNGGRIQTYDDSPFYIAGVDWREQKILALKSTHHFKAWWADQVPAIIACDSPGIHSADLSGVPLERANKSYYPLGNPEWNV